MDMEALGNLMSMARASSDHVHVFWALFPLTKMLTQDLAISPQIFVFTFN